MQPPQPNLNQDTTGDPIPTTEGDEAVPRDLNDLSDPNVQLQQALGIAHHTPSEAPDRQMAPEYHIARAEQQSRCWIQMAAAYQQRGAGPGSGQAQAGQGDYTNLPRRQSCITTTVRSVSATVIGAFGGLPVAPRVRDLSSDEDLQV